MRSTVRDAANRIFLAITRGMLTRANDAPKMQTVDLDGLRNEQLAGVERLQDYGFTSVPKPGDDTSFCRATARTGRRVTATDGAGSTVILDGIGNIKFNASGAVSLTAATIQLIAAAIIGGCWQYVSQARHRCVHGGLQRAYAFLDQRSAVDPDDHGGPDVDDDRGIDHAGYPDRPVRGTPKRHQRFRAARSLRQLAHPV